MNDYLDLARLGKNEWWRYLLAVITILFAWQIVGSGPSLILILWTMLDGNPATSVTPEATFTGIPVTISFVAFMLASWAFLAGIFLAIRFIHSRKFLSLVTPLRRLDWKRLFQGFVVWFVLAAMAAIVESLLHPGRYVLTLDLGGIFLLFSWRSFYCRSRLLQKNCSSEGIYCRVWGCGSGTSGS